MIEINEFITIKNSEVKFTFIRSPGPGGQNVNKVASGAQLRFNILNCSSLPENVRTRLLALVGKKITQDGDLIIKATSYRTQERNKQDALDRLIDLINQAAIIPKKRKRTKPSKTSIERRLVEKKQHSKTKSLRGRNAQDE